MTSWYNRLPCRKRGMSMSCRRYEPLQPGLRPSRPSQCLNWKTKTPSCWRRTPNCSVRKPQTAGHDSEGTIALSFVMLLSEKFPLMTHPRPFLSTGSCIYLSSPCIKWATWCCIVRVLYLYRPVHCLVQECLMMSFTAKAASATHTASL